MQSTNNTLLEIFAYIRKHLKHTNNHNLRIVDKIILYKLSIEPTSIRNLVNYTGLTQANISQILRKLENEKLIERKIDKEDQRIKNVYLTSKGSALIKTIRKEQAKSFNQMFEKFDKKDQNQMQKLLQEVLSIIQKYS